QPNHREMSVREERIETRKLQEELGCAGDNNVAVALYGQPRGIEESEVARGRRVKSDAVRAEVPVRCAVRIEFLDCKAGHGPTRGQGVSGDHYFAVAKNDDRVGDQPGWN